MTRTIETPFIEYYYQFDGLHMTLKCPTLEDSYDMGIQSIKTIGSAIVVMNMALRHCYDVNYIKPINVGRILNIAGNICSRNNQ